jgi:hypothetical protein
VVSYFSRTENRIAVEVTAQNRGHFLAKPTMVLLDRFENLTDIVKFFNIADPTRPDRNKQESNGTGDTHRGDPSLSGAISNL